MPWVGQGRRGEGILTRQCETPGPTLEPAPQWWTAHVYHEHLVMNTWLVAWRSPLYNLHGGPRRQLLWIVVHVAPALWQHSGHVVSLVVIVPRHKWSTQPPRNKAP